MEASPELAEIIVNWFKAAETGDASWRDRHVSRHAKLRIVGTDPEEWLQGEPAYRFLKDEAENVGGKVQVQVAEVEAYRDGDVGWGLARPIITIADGRKVSPRWSAVFIREDGGWKLIQLHASVAIGNEEAFGDTFTP
ncbi:MAG: nuclear transport factor 2 family protein [Chloroflexi bacterium]|nr:nuclear transport factor 2 family protein [Chloroflexota bacterium]